MSPHQAPAQRHRPLLGGRVGTLLAGTLLLVPAGEVAGALPARAGVPAPSATSAPAPDPTPTPISPPVPTDPTVSPTPGPTAPPGVRVVRAARSVATTVVLPPLPAPPPLPGVTVLGDSLTWDACGRTEQRVPASLRLTTAGCFGWPGATSAEVRAFVEDQRFRSSWPGTFAPTDTFDVRRAVASSRYLVVGLGTNDALRDRRRYDTARWPAGDLAPVPSGHVPVGNGYFDEQVDAFLRLADGRPVFWYDVGVRTSDPLLAGAARARNDALHRATRRWPNLRVLPWSGVVAAHPEFLLDEVHVDARGSAARWDLLGAALR